MATFNDAASLQVLFQDALSPITNYSQGLLQLAIGKRQREAQLADEARRRGEKLEDMTREEKFQLQRDTDARTARQAEASAAMGFDLARIDIENANLIQRQKDTYALADQKVKEQKLEAEKDKAIRNGIKLPADSTYADYVEANAKAQGQKLTAALRSVGDTLNQYSSAIGQTKQEIWKASMAQAIASTAPKSLKKLSITDLQDLQSDPATSAKVIQKVAASGNRDLFNVVSEISANAAQATQAGMATAEKDKGLLQGASERYKTANEVLQSFLKNQDFSPDDIVKALQGFSRAANPTPVAAPQQRLSPAEILGRASPQAMAAPQASELNPVSPAQMARFQQLAQPTPATNPFVAPGMGGNMLMVPPAMQPGAIPNPSLQSFLKRNAVNQNAIAPTAFPPAFDSSLAGFSP